MEMEQLPDDMLANVLGRLPPCSLAASRCVRKRWCSIIDARRLLRTDLLPLRVEAFFCNSHFLFEKSFLFAPPSVARRIPGGRLDFFNDDGVSLVAMDHCNGLLLHYHTVVNPATRQWAKWPPVPQHLDDLSMSNKLCISLVYDPLVSPNHYEVFLIPLLPPGCKCNDDDRSSSDDGDHRLLLQQEWPSLTYTAYVFSSSTKESRWEERSFVRQGGEAAGTIADMMHIQSSSEPKGAYFRRSLYVPCPNNSVMRLSLSDFKYQMIRPPPATASARSKTKTTDDDDYVSTYIGKSEKGIYFALIDLDGPQFRVWLLSESSTGQTEWVLKCNVHLAAVVNFAINNRKYDDGPWIINYIKNSNKEKETPTTAQEEEKEEFVEWDFNNGAIIPQNKTKDNWLHLIHFLGFHPYKEVAFLCISQSRTISYHLNSSKVQYLGTISIPEMENAFLYTPCWMGELSEKNKA